MATLERAAVAAADVHEEVLDNGLRVLVQEVHTAPLASVWCWYRVGSKDETTGLTGVSHWVEHMNFKGTTNIPRDKVKGIIEQFGGYWNGYTWIDQTTYLETATRDALDRMLFIEAERMASCLYDPEDCESERTVIISELQGGRTIPTRCSTRSSPRSPSRRIHTAIRRLGGCPICRTMTRDDLYSVTTADSTSPTTPRWSSSGMSTPTRRCAASCVTSVASRRRTSRRLLTRSRSSWASDG